MERNEAIEVVKKNWPDSSFTRLREALETLIPELKESEDERIREAIIKCLKWLRDEARWTDVYGSSFDSIFSWLEKQGEQKPAWSEEDEKILNLIIARLHSHPNVEVEEYGKDYHWLNSLKERYTWKPSDEQMLAINTAINVLGKGTISGEYLIELQEELKKLKA